MEPLTDDGLHVGVRSPDPLVENFLQHQLEAQGIATRSLKNLEAADLADLDVAIWDLGPTPDPTQASALAGVATVALCTSAEVGAAALAAGCAAAVDRSRTPDALLRTIHAVAAGLVVAEPGWFATPTPTRTDSPLSPREQEVLEQLAEGLSNREIGQQLFVSEHTVRFHVRSILEKLDATSRTQAVVHGARAGLLDF